MKPMSLEEVRLHLAEVPAKKFGNVHETCAIGQLHRILTGGTSYGFNGNVFPPDVARAVAVLNDYLSPEDRKALAMMMPLPQAFPELTPARAIKLVLWAGEQALGYYDGPEREVLERAVALAKRAAAGEAYTEEEAAAAFVAADKIRWTTTKSQLVIVAIVIQNTANALLSVLKDESWSIPTGEAAGGMARIVVHTEADWREWMEEYLRIRTEVKV